jgi:hypothetical protein
LEDELYSKNDMLAFQRVGEFLCWFSMLETAKNRMRADSSETKTKRCSVSIGQRWRTYWVGLQKFRIRSK